MSRGSPAADRVEACLARIEERDPVVHAWAHLDADHAREQAAARDEAGGAGPLHGVPVGVKAIIDVAGMPTERGSPVFAGRRPDTDATVVARLRDAGAVVLGMTVTTELALFHPGPTRNPHDPQRTPGGSSSGSAAAVADGHVPLALGTQTAGSVVRPAAFCGVFGLKPTAHEVPTDGVLVVSPTLDTIGGFARDVADLRILHAVLVGAAAPGARPPLQRPRVGVLRTPDWDAIDPGCRDVLDAAFDRLDDHGQVEELTLPTGFDGLVEAQGTVMGVEAARSLSPLVEQHAEQLSQELRTYLDAGARRGFAYDAALTHADGVRADVDEALRAFDVVVTPAVLGEAPVGDATGDPLLCRPWTLLGTPAVAVPGLTGPAGLPLGVQVVAPRGADEDALDAAAWLAGALR